jgi:hypothetical protein
VLQVLDPLRESNHSALQAWRDSRTPPAIRRQVARAVKCDSGSASLM